MNMKNKLERPLTVSVYYQNSDIDTTLNGMSSKYSTLRLAEIGHDEFITKPDQTLAIIREPQRDYIFVVPWEARHNPRPRWAFGGNLIFTSDSRFGGVPLKVHDRDMNKEVR